MSGKRSLPSVARSRRFQQALGKRLAALDRNLPAALQHDAEALHRTRVASRRLREVLPVIETPVDSGDRSARKRRGRVRRLTQALGRVRELDVALALLDEFASSRPELAPPVGAVRSEIQRERAVRYAAMIRSVEDIKPRKLAHDLSSLAATVRSSGKEQQRRLRARLLARARRLDTAVEEAGALYAFDRLHTVRIAAKKLRYSLELVPELTRLGTQRLVGRVKQIQDLLGRLHDLEILAAYVRRAGQPSPPQPPVDVTPLLRLIEQETRQLHADYLSKAQGLRLVTAACREEIGPRLG